MANIGISNASYYTDTSISRLKRQVDTSVEKISSNKSNITNGEKTSLVSMDNSFKLVHFNAASLSFLGLLNSFRRLQHQSIF